MHQQSLLTFIYVPSPYHRKKQNKTVKRLQENAVIVTEQELCFELSENQGISNHEKNRLRQTKLGPNNIYVTYKEH